MAILDRYGQRRWHELWNGIDYIAMPGEAGRFESIVNAPGIRPYHLAKTAEKWTYNLSFRPDVSEIKFTDYEMEFAKKYANGVYRPIILEPHIKARASPNKQWPWTKWNKLAYYMQKEGLRVTQLGPRHTALLDGAEHIVTPTFRQAAAVLQHARAAVLPDGGLHHAAAALGVPAVVLMMGFTPIELTGYPIHRNIGVSLGAACGSRQPCAHCEAEMAKITPERVFRELKEILNAA